MTDAMQTIRKAFKELISIVEIHSRNTGNNFAWAELPDAQQALYDKGANHEGIFNWLASRCSNYIIF